MRVVKLMNGTAGRAGRVPAGLALIIAGTAMAGLAASSSRLSAWSPWPPGRRGPAWPRRYCGLRCGPAEPGAEDDRRREHGPGQAAAGGDCRAARSRPGRLFRAGGRYWPSSRHADDVTFGLGAIVDSLAAGGAAVHVLCFTRGEASTLNENHAELSQARDAELRQAAAELGAAAVTLLDYPDGHLSDQPAEELSALVTRLAARLGAEGLLVFDDTGITGHPDHQAATAPPSTGRRRPGCPSWPGRCQTPSLPGCGPDRCGRGGFTVATGELPTSPLLERMRRGVIGEGELLDGPFGARRVTYADYTASGRSLDFIEDFIRDAVLPRYANTHTESSGTGLATSRLREDARRMIRDAVGGSEDDLVIFCGSGATAAVSKLIGILELRIPAGLDERYRLSARIPEAEPAGGVRRPL